jgi:hypothetical protein
VRLVNRPAYASSTIAQEWYGHRVTYTETGLDVSPETGEGHDVFLTLDEFRELDRTWPEIAAATRYKPGDVAVAGRPGFWSWALISEVDGPWVYFQQIDARDAATHGQLVVATVA